MKASISAALAVPIAAIMTMVMASVRMTKRSFAAIPGVEQIGEPVIAESGDLMNARQAGEPGEPTVARGRAPNGDGAIGADVQAAIGVDAVQPAVHIRKRGAEAGERFGIQNDVEEFDSAGAGGAHQTAALPVDAGVTDRAFGIVPDRELRTHCRRFAIDRGRATIHHVRLRALEGRHDRRRRHRARTLGQIHRRSGAGQEQTPALHSRREQRARARCRFRQDPRFRAGHGIFRRGRRSARAGGVPGDAAFAARRRRSARWRRRASRCGARSRWR